MLLSSVACAAQRCCLCVQGTQQACVCVCTPCRYLFAAELPRGGKGSPTNYTGLVWGGFRPSDDGQVRRSV